MSQCYDQSRQDILSNTEVNSLREVLEAFLKILIPELLPELRQNLVSFSQSSLARIYLWTLTRETVALCLPGLCVFHWAKCPDKDKHFLNYF